LNIFKAEASS